MNGNVHAQRPLPGELTSFELNGDDHSVGGSSDTQPFDSANNSFSDVSLASAGRSGSPSRPVSRLSRQTLAEHQAATNGNTEHEHAINGHLHDTTGSLQDSIPEMLRIKDLDSGKEYNLDKVSVPCCAIQPASSHNGHMYFGIARRLCRPT